MSRNRWIASIGLAALAAGAGCPPPPRRAGKHAAWVADTSSFAPLQAPRPASLAERYAGTAASIIAAARADHEAYRRLAHLTDRIGHRLAGSAALDRAIAWAAQTMKDDGHDVRTEPVLVPHWVRGAEDAAIVAPVARPLRVLALGGTVPTPRGGLTAPLVVVRSWDELDARAAEVKGAIVLFDVALAADPTDKAAGYGAIAAYRARGTARAARHGAVATLMRSVTARSLSTLHTGSTSYDSALPKIPAAAVTLEDALYLARLAAAGPVTVRLRLEAQQLPDAPSANVIGELRGRERPEEIVVLGAHLDSWDVGQGAHDDGGGCVMAMQALTVLRRLGLAPRRTIRVVLFTNEENGLRGARAYGEAHAAEAASTVLAVEADMGAFAPHAFGIEAEPPERAARARARVAEIAALLRPLAALQTIVGYSGADLIPLVAQGVLAMGYVTDPARYFDYHHSEADTLDKVDPADLAAGVAALAVLAYVAADLPGRLDDE